MTRRRGNRKSAKESEAHDAASPPSSTIVLHSSLPDRTKKPPSDDAPAPILKPLSTKAEVETRDEIVHAYMVKVPTKATGEIVGAIKRLPDFDSNQLAHLRRVAKNDFIPESLSKYVAKERAAAAAAAAGPAAGKRNGKPCPTKTVRAPISQLVFLCPITLASKTEVEQILAWTSPFQDPEPPKIFTIPVPRNPPISAEHCKDLSERYWPVIYNNTNPYGPHPSIVARMTDQAGTSAAKWMALAREVANEAGREDEGWGIGAVITERVSNGTERVVAVAGDSRWQSPAFYDTPGDPARHAIMRLIALVAEKRLRIDSDKHRGTDRPAVDAPTTTFPSNSGDESPLSPLEEEYFNQLDTITPRGYLCLNLNIYITHEPCICCTMAALHSRVGGIIFDKEMPATGGLVADRHVGHLRTGKRARARIPRLLEGLCAIEYGLFWRDDLNWKFHAWQFEMGDEQATDSYAELPREVHA